jgi:hypothetical protein
VPYCCLRSAVGRRVPRPLAGVSTAFGCGFGLDSSAHHGLGRNVALVFNRIVAVRCAVDHVRHPLHAVPGIVVSLSVVQPPSCITVLAKSIIPAMSPVIAPIAKMMEMMSLMKVVPKFVKLG